MRASCSSGSRRRSRRRWRRRARSCAIASRSVAATEVVDMDEPPADALRKKKDSSMRVAINLVKDGDGARVRFRRQHRRADGDRALRAEDAARHRPSGDRVATADARPATRSCSTSAPTSTARRSTWCSSRRWAARWSAAVDGIERPTVGLLNIGEEDIKGNDVVKADGRAAEGVDAQLLRQRRRRRHLQGHDRRRRLRRLRRQRRR